MESLVMLKNNPGYKNINHQKKETLKRKNTHFVELYLGEVDE